MVEFVRDPQFDNIVDFDLVRRVSKLSADQLYPNFNILASVQEGTKAFSDQPSYMIAAGASLLAYSILLAAEEYEMAASMKDQLWSLGWTEEHAGSDLLSNVTVATPIEGDTTGKQYHIKGRKWLINNSYHADYHLVVAKIDPNQNGPRALTLFAVPRSSIKSWERLETHMLSEMVLTTYEIDGPGTLVGKIGHGLTILQRMAMPSKYICTYSGIRIMDVAVRAAIDHLATKHIFETEPLKFSNVFRQMYHIALQSAFYSFMYYRALAFSDSSFLQFHGTTLKSYVLLRVNEVLSKTLLVAGSKGFLKQSPIGESTFVSFVLPVFDGHYTINTLMTAKQFRAYIDATERGDVNQRISYLRQKLFVAEVGNQMNAKPSDIRKPAFFDWVDYWQQLNVPLPIDAKLIIDRVRALLNELDQSGAASEAEYKYKSGTLLHWLESIQAAGEMWRVFADDAYLNAVVQQYNGFVDAFNAVVAEGGLQTPFLTPIHFLPFGDYDRLAPETFLYSLINLQEKLPQAAH